MPKASLKTCQEVLVSAKFACPSYLKKLMSIGYGSAPRSLDPYSGACIQLQGADKLIYATSMLKKANITSVAYIGAYPEYYLSMCSELQENYIEEVFLLDSSMELLNKTHWNTKSMLKDSQKWFLQIDYDNWILEKDAVDLLVINDNLNLNFSADLSKTVNDMTSSLKENGNMLGMSTSQTCVEEIKHAAKDNKLDMEVIEIEQNVHYPNNLFLYGITKRD
jgi:hypothetical protein